MAESESLSLTFTLPGVPPSFGNMTHLHWRAIHALQTPWKDLSFSLGHSARNRQHWRHVTEDSHRVVECVQYRTRLLDRHDNLGHAAKPIIDGLKKVLIWDDDAAHADIRHRQEKVQHLRDERVVLTITKETPDAHHSRKKETPLPGQRYADRLPPAPKQGGHTIVQLGPRPDAAYSARSRAGHLPPNRPLGS